ATATIQVEDPSKPSKPSKGGTNLQVNRNHQHIADYEAIKPLPKTGDQTTPWLVWIGLGLLVTSFLLWLFNRRRSSFK
ncbi:hypothetical protein C1907_08090, partial [Listeria ivanovii]|uniref:LPXTG cell wall anchor domain-containing protein n=1 Tax=Listeria ivanovii TaxID=1638 RepID=UPI000DC28F70